MKIEVGKRYVRRDGFITPPLMTPDPSYADPGAWAYFIDGVNGRVRYLLGECVYASYNLDPSCTEFHEHDLVAEFSVPEKEMNTTLNDRGTNYGEFHSQAAISQELSDVMAATPKWPELSSAQREALQMIQHKIARILNGNPLYIDSWIDIVGYAELGKRETERLCVK